MVVIGVDADDLAVARVDLALVFVGGVADFALEEALFDGRQHASKFFDPAPVIVDLRLDLVRLVFDEEAATQRIDGVGYAALFGDDLLRAHGDGHGFFTGQGQRLVHAVGVQALRAAEDGSQRLDGDAHDVVLRLLGSQADACRLGVEAQEPGAWVAGAKRLAHLPRPDAARRTELGNLLKEVVMAVEEEAKARGEVVYVQAACDGPAHVLQAIAQGEGQLLRRRRSRLADVVAADGDGVPQGHLARAELDRVGDEAHRRLWREDVLFLGDVLLENVVLQRSPELRARHALFLCGGNIHGPDNRGGAVDSHARADLAQRDTVKEDLHVLQAADSHAAGAELAQRFRRVRVIAHQGCQVEGHGKPHVALLEQVFVARVGLLGRAETGKHAHRPGLAAVHRAVDAARIRVVAREAEMLVVVEIGHVEGRVQPIDGLARRRQELPPPLRRAGQGALQGRLFPLLASFLNLRQFLVVVHSYGLLIGGQRWISG